MHVEFPPIGPRRNHTMAARRLSVVSARASSEDDLRLQPGPVNESVDPDFDAIELTDVLRGLVVHGVATDEDTLC